MWRPQRRRPSGGTRADDGRSSAKPRAQNLFLRDREVQLACLGAAEVLCRSAKNRTVATTLVDAGCLSLLESTVDQFAGDVEITAQGLRTLVEIALCGTVAGKSCPEPTVEAGATAKWCDDQCNTDLSQPPSLPFLESNGDQSTGETISSVPVTKRPDGKSTNTTTAAAAVDAFRAVGIVLAVMERTPCREVCFSAFDALGRLLAILGTMDPTGVRAKTGDDSNEARASSTAFSGGTARDRFDGAAVTRGSLEWAKVGHAVQRALKVNRRDDTDLAASASKVLALVAAARGRALAQ